MVAMAVPIYEKAAKTECDVCVVLNRDRKPKKTTFCKLCGAYLCRRHRNRFDLRALAAFKVAARWLQKENK